MAASGGCWPACWTAWCSLGVVGFILGWCRNAQFATELPIASTTPFWGLRGGACRESDVLKRMAVTRRRPRAACTAMSDAPVVVYQWYGFGGRGRRRADAINHCPGRPWTCVRSFRPETFAGADAIWVWVGGRPEAHCLPPQRAAHVWVLEHLEAPSYYPQLYDRAFVRRFSLKLSYEADADVIMTAAHPSSEGGLIPPAEWSHAPWHERRAAMVWLSSNCESTNRREALVTLLRAKLPNVRLRLDAFGACARAAGSEAPAHLLPPTPASADERRTAGPSRARANGTAATRALLPGAAVGGAQPGLPRPNRRRLKNLRDWAFKLDLFSRYRFCLVAENSVAPWYVTEKLLHAFAAGCVPVYYGTPDVRAFLPTPQSAVLVMDFPSVSALVRELQRLSQPQARQAVGAQEGAEHEAALGWRRNATFVREWWERLRRMTAADTMPSRTEQMCAICDKVRRIRCAESAAAGAAASSEKGGNSAVASGGARAEALGRASPRKALQAVRRPAVEVWPPLVAEDRLHNWRYHRW